MLRRTGYARVSSEDQNLHIQKEALDRDRCGIVFEEKRSGTKRGGGEQLDLAHKVLAKGDTLVVTRLDRLGRSLRDLANIAHEIDDAGAHLRVIEQSVDTATSAGGAFFGMLAVFARFETDVSRDRQAEEIAKAKKAGVRRTSDRSKSSQRSLRQRARPCRRGQVAGRFANVGLPRSSEGRRAEGMILPSMVASGISCGCDQNGMRGVFPNCSPLVCLLG